MLKDQVVVMFEKLDVLVRHLIAKDNTIGLNMLQEYTKEFGKFGDDLFELHDKIIEDKQLEKLLLPEHTTKTISMVEKESDVEEDK